MKTMITALNALTEGKKDTTIFFRADKTVDYEDVDEGNGYAASGGLPENRSGRRRNCESEINDARLLSQPGIFLT